MPGKKALFVRFSSLGDVIMSNYYAMLVKQIYPDWHITWLVDSLYAPIVRAQPWIDSVIEWDRKNTGNTGFLKILRSVRQSKFDIAIDMHSTDRSCFFVCLSGIPIKYGDRNSSIPFKIYARDLSGSLFKNNGDISSCPSYLAADAPTEKAQALFTGDDLPRRLIIMAIGASYEKKRWPAGSWIQFALLAAEKGYRMIMVGEGSAEQRMAREIEQALRPGRVVNMVGELSLSELVYVISRGDIAVSGDTGPLHIARALGVPVVAMFGPSRVAKKYMASFYRTLFASCDELGCASWACGKPCLETIRPEQMLACVEEYFDETEVRKNDR